MVNPILNQSVSMDSYFGSYRVFFVDLCKDKKVLHIGCFDYPIFDPSTNLHLKLANSAKILHGLDIIENYEETMKTYYDGVYYNKYEDVHESYDIILVPEVIEHVTNPEQFLKNIFSIKATEIFITGPNAFYERGSYYDESTNIFHEIVHGDHKVWYSPYTLYNTVKPYINDNDKIQMYFLTNKSSVGIKIIKTNE